MKTTYTLFIALLVIFTPMTAGAAGVAYRLSDTHALFAVPFEFRTGAEEFRIPLQINPSSVVSENAPFVGYTLTRNGATTTTGFTGAGLVLSDLEIEDNSHYVLPANSRGSYMLFTIVSLPAGTPTQNVSVSISNIPYLRADSERKNVKVEDLRHLTSPSVVMGTTLLK